MLVWKMTCVKHSASSAAVLVNAIKAVPGPRTALCLMPYDPANGFLWLVLNMIHIAQLLSTCHWRYTMGKATLYGKEPMPCPASMPLSIPVPCLPFGRYVQCQCCKFPCNGSGGLRTRKTAMVSLMHFYQVHRTP